MKKAFLLLYAVLYTTVSLSQTKEEIDKLAASYLNKKEAALVIGIRQNGQNKIFYYGKGSGNAAPGPTDLFEIGTTTEILTTFIYSELVHEGIIGADDPLQRHLPTGAKAPEYTNIVCTPVDKDVPFDKDQPQLHFTPYICRPDPKSEPQPMLLCYLANHTSGLPDLPSNCKERGDKYRNYSADDLISFLKKYETINKMEYDYKHSSLGMGLLGYVMEKKSGSTFDQILQRKFSAPLGLQSTFIASEKDDVRLLTGHNAKGKKVSHNHYGVLSPSLSAVTTASDIMRILEVSMDGEHNHISDIIAYNQKPRVTFNQEKAMALGWKTKKNEKGNITYQSGLTNGFASFIGLTNDRKNGIIILSSIAKDSEELGFEILKSTVH